MDIPYKQQYDTNQPPKRIIKPAETYRYIGISGSEGERRVKGDPHFPKKVRLGPRSVGYVLAEVDAYIDHLIAASRSPTPRPTSKPQAVAPQTRLSGKPEPVAPQNSGKASGEAA